MERDAVRARLEKEAAADKDELKKKLSKKLLADEDEDIATKVSELLPTTGGG
jgi:hypothetical protein